MRSSRVDSLIIEYGHLLECAGQVTGGYFADPGRKEVPGLARLGFPFADIAQDGSGVLGKVAGSGGRITPATCTEQLLYEVLDPASYVQPDVVADFTGVRFVELEPDRIAFSGATGRPRPETLKVSVGYRDSFLGEGQISYAGPGAAARGRLALDIVRERLELTGVATTELRLDLIGIDAACPGVRREHGAEPAEVRVRIAGRTACMRDAVRIGNEVESLYTNGPAAAAARGSRRARLSPWCPHSFRERSCVHTSASRLPEMRLHALAHARTGDKGDTSQISVIAYDPADYPHLAREVTAARVRDFFGSMIGGPVERFELAGLGALSFVLHAALAGGVTRSLALDPHGKCLGSILLDLDIAAPDRR